MLLTARFIELNPDIAASVHELAELGRLSTRTISGVAALELDLIGEGIGAVLRRAPGSATRYNTGREWAFPC